MLIGKFTIPYIYLFIFSLFPIMQMNNEKIRIKEYMLKYLDYNNLIFYLKLSFLSIYKPVNHNNCKSM